MLPDIHWPKAPIIGVAATSALAILLAVTVLPVLQSGKADTARPPAARPTIAKVGTTEEPAAPPPSTSTGKPELIASSAPSKVPQVMPTPPAPPERQAAPPSEKAQADKPLPAKADVPTKPMRMAEMSSPAPAKAAQPKPAAVDEKARVATLQSMSASFYNQAINNADDVRRSQLQQARDLFVNARNACRSDSCVGDAHANYIRDISRIMQKAK